MGFLSTFKRIFPDPSLERDFFILCASLLIILLGFLGIIARETHQNQQRIGQRELENTLKTIEDTLSASVTGTSEFVQYIGNEVLNTYDGKPESALHLFKHDFSVDTKLNSFYAWTLLSWVNAQNMIVIAPTGIKRIIAPSNYPLTDSKIRPWILHIGSVAVRDGYSYLPSAMGVESDAHHYVGAITTDILTEKLQNDIRHVLRQNYSKYHYVLRDELGSIIIDSCPQEKLSLTDIKTFGAANDSFIITANQQNVVSHRISWGNKIFYLDVTYAAAPMPGSKFWNVFLPYFYLAGTLTLIFLALIYTFRKRTILPVIHRLRSNLVEEIEVRKEKDRFLEQILSGIAGFIYRHRVDGNQIICEFVSEGCLQLTGYPPSHYFGPNRVKHTDVIHPEYTQYVIKHIQDAILHHRAFEISYPIITASGVTKWVLNQGHPIINESGLFEGLLTDITEMKHTEKKMEETLRALKLSNSELEEFAYACSHDLKEPLRTIFSYIQLYRYDPNAQYLEFIETSTLRMKSLIENILLYSQLGINAPVVEEVTPLKDLVEHVMTMMSGSIAETQAAIHLDVSGSVIGDRQQFYRLLQNLLSNALKFKGADSPSIEIGATLQEGPMWRIHVKDNGIGIDAQFHDKIFDLFRRLHSQDQYQGSGIGLTICKKIVERHGGTIGVGSVVGAGSTFFFTLPAAT